MYNLLIALAALGAVFGLVFAVGASALTAAFPALVAGAGAYVWLARRSMKQLEAIMMAGQAHLQEQRIDAALAKMQEGFALAPWQFLVAGQVHAQIGSVLFMLKRFDEARPHLEKSFGRITEARAMLGVLQYQAKQSDAMVATFTKALALNDKAPVVWAVFAWCLDKLGRRTDAVASLSRGVAANGSSATLKACQLALSNGEPMPMRDFGQMWWVFHLEQPSTQDLLKLNPQLAQSRAAQMQQEMGKKGYRGYKDPRQVLRDRPE